MNKKNNKTKYIYAYICISLDNYRSTGSVCKLQFVTTFALEGITRCVGTEWTLAVTSVRVAVHAHWTTSCKVDHIHVTMDIRRWKLVFVISLHLINVSPTSHTIIVQFASPPSLFVNSVQSHQNIISKVTVWLKCHFLYNIENIISICGGGDFRCYN